MSSDKFQNKYRIPSTRAQWWDYSANGYYFITICTANREHYFGEIASTPDERNKYWWFRRDKKSDVK